MPFDFIMPEEASHKSIQFQDKTKNKQPFAGFESTYLHKNGQHVVLDTSGMPVFNSLDQFLAIVASVVISRTQINGNKDTPGSLRVAKNL